MQARPCLPSDIKSINKWLKRHGMPPSTSEQLPKLGFIVPGVAAGFIRDCETGVGMIDSLISNELVTSETRHKAWEAISEQLLAQPFKYKFIMTADSGMQGRFAKLNFLPAPEYLWMLRSE